MIVFLWYGTGVLRSATLRANYCAANCFASYNVLGIGGYS